MLAIKNFSFLKVSKKNFFLVFLLLLIIIGLFLFTKSFSGKRKTLLTTPNKEKIATLWLEPKEVVIKKGTSFELSINVDTNDRMVNGIDAMIGYDPQFFDVLGKAENGDLFENLLINDVNQLGRINLTASRLSKDEAPILGKGILAKIKLMAKKKGQPTVSFIFDPQKTNTSNVIESVTSKNILTHVENSNVKIEE